ncbi:ABC transporter permease [Gimesia aquarii]
MSMYDLTPINIGLAVMLVLINGIISIWMKLKLEKQLLLASIRAIVQLLLIGLILEWIFELSWWPIIGLLMFTMTLIASLTAVQRSQRRFPGIWLNSTVAVFASSWLVTGFALAAIIPPHSWSENPAQYLIPLLGMILGNTLNGISLGLDRLSEELVMRRAEVELKLTLGATRNEAARQALQNAVRSGMTPIINSMMVVGLVSLPGLMTGQILAGASPLDSVKYQIVIMFLIASGTALGTVISVLLGFRCLFNSKHQFLFDQIRRVG